MDIVCFKNYYYGKEEKFKLAIVLLFFVLWDLVNKKIFVGYGINCGMGMIIVS